MIMEAPLKVLLAHSSWLPGVQIWDKNLVTRRYTREREKKECTNFPLTPSHLAHINFLLVALAAKHKPVPLKLNPSIGSTAVVLFLYISLFLGGLKWLGYQYTWSQVDAHSKWLSGLSLAQLKVVDDNLQSQYNMVVRVCQWSMTMLMNNLAIEL